jgi:hypothetical protein
MKREQIRTWWLSFVGELRLGRIRFRKYKVAPRLGNQIVRRRLLSRLRRSMEATPSTASPRLPQLQESLWNRHSQIESAF